MKSRGVTGLVMAGLVNLHSGQLAGKQHSDTMSDEFIRHKGVGMIDDVRPEGHSEGSQQRQFAAGARRAVRRAVSCAALAARAADCSAIRLH